MFQEYGKDLYFPGWVREMSVRTVMSQSQGKDNWDVGLYNLSTSRYLALSALRSVLQLAKGISYGSALSQARLYRTVQHYVYSHACSARFSPRARLGLGLALGAGRGTNYVV